MVEQKPPLVVIAGPTASGKSALALDLAQQIDGVIVNADSAQIYRDLRVLSASPSDEELTMVEHRLYGVQDAAFACSAADWAIMARNEIKLIHAASKTPILVGGTGLYLRSLIDGIAPVPAIDPDVRARVRNADVAENCAMLQSLDPVASARINSNDTSRIARALEVILSTGRSLKEWQGQRQGGIGQDIELRSAILLPPREWLYARCNARFLKMVDAGAISEVEALLGRKLNESLPAMRAIGVAELATYIRGEKTLSQAIEAGQQATRRYAKRQYTWFARQPPSEWARFERPLDPQGLGQALALLQPGR